MADSDSNKLKIRLHIYDSEINVGIPREEEELYRKGGNLINELLNVYYSNFKGTKSDKEINYFVMIDLALRLERQLMRNDTKPYDEIIGKLTSEIEDALNEKK